MAEAEILVVEDDSTIARFVELELKHAGFGVRHTADGKDAVALFDEKRPDLVVLDLMLPGMDGLDVARHMRAAAPEVPILMLTARSETHDVVAGFEAGADDYMRKPFEIPELLSRVRALLKRTEKDREKTVFSASGVTIDSVKRRATVGEAPIELTAKEFDLLLYLVSNAGRVISRDEILQAVWGGQHSTDSNVIEVFVCHLRGKIDDRDNSIIQTIRGVGYFFAGG